MAQVNLAKVTIANNAPVGKLGIFVTPDNEAFLIDENGAVYAFGGGASSFLALTDTPVNYIGQATKAVRVNAGATGLEFVDFPAGFDGDPSSLNQEGATNGQAIVWNGAIWAPANVAADITAEDGLKKIGTVITLGDNVTVFFTPISLAGRKDGTFRLLGESEIDSQSNDGLNKAVFKVFRESNVFPQFDFIGTKTATNDTLTGVVFSRVTERAQGDFYGRHSSGREGGFYHKIRNIATLGTGDSLDMQLSNAASQLLRLSFYMTGSGEYRAQFVDSINNKGLEYEADYSANFTARSLVDKGYVDTTLLNNAVYLTGDQTINGIKTFISSPIVPTPTTDFQAATKAYVDAVTGSASQLVTNQVFNFVTNTVTLDFIPDDMLYVGLNGQLTDEWTRTGDQLTVTNFTEGFIIVGYYKAIVIGGANVETVTGAGVDNTDPANPVIGYQEATLRENNSVLFDKDYIIGNAGARTGNITFDFTGAKLGATVVMRHQDALAFTIPTEAKTLSGTYDGAVDNYLWFVLTDKTAATEIVQLTISQIQP